mmetsp:Transcript_35501/g.56928  ORF Transcript_35501/g.56928 Transcript_35501/m.56928 type:complete len:400 (-) Transcript_35501:346-1545(-)
MHIVVVVGERSDNFIERRFGLTASFLVQRFQKLLNFFIGEAGRFIERTLERLLQFALFDIIHVIGKSLECVCKFESRFICIHRRFLDNFLDPLGQRIRRLFSSPGFSSFRRLIIKLHHILLHLKLLLNLLDLFHGGHHLFAQHLLLCLQYLRLHLLHQRHLFLSSFSFSFFFFLFFAFLDFLHFLLKVLLQFLASFHQLLPQSLGFLGDLLQLLLDLFDLLLLRIHCRFRCQRFHRLRQIPNAFLVDNLLFFLFLAPLLCLCLCHRPLLLLHLFFFDRHLLLLCFFLRQFFLLFLLPLFLCFLSLLQRLFLGNQLLLSLNDLLLGAHIIDGALLHQHLLGRLLANRRDGVFQHLRGVVTGDMLQRKDARHNEQSDRHIVIQRELEPFVQVGPQNPILKI